MDYKVVYTKSSQRDLARLENAVAQSMLMKIGVFVKNGDPLAKAKKLKGVDIATQQNLTTLRISRKIVFFCNR